MVSNFNSFYSFVFTMTSQKFNNGDMGLFPLTNPEMGCLQILKPSMFQSKEEEGYLGLGVERKNLSLKLGDGVEQKKSLSVKTGYSKLCSRGHWRPGEDAKLKELVAEYGPQNWNLIAEHLQGRSGNH